MDRTERFYRIEMLIRSRGSVPFLDLMSELEVSRATLKRDLEYLRSRLDAPIVYDRDSNGYRFDAAVSAGPRGRKEASHELPGVWFSEREIHALLTMHHMIAGLDAGGLLSRHLSPLLEKLNGMLGTSPSESKEMIKRVRIAHPATRPVDAVVFERVGSALMKRQRLQIRYFTRSKGQESERAVSPQRLLHFRNTWYLDAWCHQSEGLRRFALDAVRAVELVEQRAKDVALRTVEAELDAGYGVFSGKALRWATLRFTPEAAQWVANEVWHPAQTQQRLADGSLRLKLPYNDDTELAMDVLRHGAHVVVESPRELVRVVAARARATAAQYAHV